MASETASLVIAVDSTDADRAVKSLRDLAQQGKVTESSLKQTGDSSRNLKRVSNEAESAARSMGLLESAAKGAVAALSIREIVGAVDGYTQLSAQIKLVTNSTQEYARAYQSVRDIARTTQADLSSTAMLYARIANATKELGVSQQTVADITEAVNLSLRVSGASAAEASSAMLQLSQAFAGGVLRGEEFNSVIESSPRLIQALAEGMGATVGQMRQLAADGKITAEVMADVLPQALGKLRDEAQHVQTISGAFQNLRNEVLELIGTQAQATGFTTVVSGGLNLLANNLNTVVAIAGTLATARIAGSIAGIAREISSLGSAAEVARRGMSLLGGGFGVLAGVLAGGVMAWMSYRESVNATRKALTDVNAPIDDLISKFKELSTLEQQAAIRGLAEAAKEAEKELAEAFENLGKVPGRLRAAPAFKEFRQEIERIKDADLGVDELDKQVASLVGSFKEATPQAQKAHEAVERLGNAVVNAAKKNEKLAQTQRAVAEITDTVGISLDRTALAAARAAAGLNTKEWDTFIQKAEAAATTVGMTAQQLGEFQARAMGASEAQSQLAGVLHGMADTARQLEKATADKDFKAIKGAQDTLAALAQQEVQLRVNIRQAEAYAALLAMGLSQASALQGSQTEAELEGLRAMEEVLQRIQNLRDNIENSAKPSKSATSAAEKATKAINDQIKALQLQAATVGMAEDQVTLYKLATEGATKAQLASAKAALDARRAGELSLAVAKRRIDTSNDAIKAAAEEAQRNIDLAETFGLSAAGIEQLTVARLEHELARAEAAGADADEIERLKILIALRQESMGALITLEQKERQKQQWEEWARDVEQIFSRVGQSLTDAIFDGGKSGKDLLRDMFKGLTFNILINPIMNQMQGWVTNQLGGLFGVQNPQQGGGILGTAQNLYSGYNALNGGLNSTFGNAAQWLGQKIGSEALTSFGLGLSGTTAATGIASIGAGLGASLGTSIGTSAAAMTTTTFSAALSGGAAAGGAAAGGAAAASGAAAGGAAGIGAAVGSALPWIGGALAIGSAFGLFDDDEPRTRHAQMSHADLGADGTFSVSTWDDRQSRESQNAAAAYATEAVRNATELFGKIGIDAEFKRFTTLMESSILGDKQGVGSSGTIRIGDLEHEIGLAIESSWTKHGVGGWSEAEMLPRLMTDVQLTILEAFQAAGDQLPSVLSGMLEGVDIRALGAEQAQELAQRFQLVVDQVSAFQSALEQLPFASLRDLTFDVSAAMISALGGIESANAALSSYFDNFYSQEEKLDWLSQQISGSLAAVGLVMPDVTQGADAAKQAFRELFESIDPLAPGGAEAAAEMLAVNGQFAELVTGLQELNGAVRSAADIARERYGLETQLLQLQGNTAALRARELEALDASNHALQRYIWSLQDQRSAWDAAVAAGESAFSALSRSVAAEKTRLQRESEAIATALRNSISAASTTVSELTSLTNRLSSTLQRMIGQGLDASRNRLWAQDRVDRALSVAKLTGVMPQGEDFEQALQIVAQPSEGLFQSFEDYQADFLKTAHTVSELNELAEGQLSTEKRALKALEDQLSNSQQWYQAEMERLDAMLEMERQSLDIAMGTYETLLTIPQALAGIQSAIANIQLIVPPAASGGGGGSGGGYAPYVDYLTGNPDLMAAYLAEGGGNYMPPEQWAQQHWDTYGKYEDRDVKLRGFAVGTNYVPYDMTARIHEGERIIPAADNRELMQMLARGVDRDNTIRLLQQEIRELRLMMERKLDGVERNTGDTARTNRQMVEQRQIVQVEGPVATVLVEDRTA